ncbi:MAG: signal peptidase II [Nitrospirae bacterium]|nr:signal peptidase II [Nitrospirota bacterium]
MPNSKPLFLIIIASLVTALDYVTKRAIESYVMPFEAIDVMPFLRIVHVKNPAGAFSLFAGLGNKGFIFISITAIIFIIIYALKVSTKLEFIALSLILGGALGNLLDRLKSGMVVDFIDLYIGSHHWPAFNIADSAITVGMILFLWMTLTQKRH